MHSRLSKVESQTLQARVYEELRGALTRGTFAPGESVSIRQLAKDMGTSPMPVREAVHRLVSERALEMRSARSLRVPELTREKFQDLTSVRCLVEPEAAGMAATRVSQEQLEVLDRENRRLMRAVKKVNLQEMLEANRAFHFTIYEAAGSPILLQVIESLWLQIGPYLQALFHRYKERMESLPTERVSEELLSAIQKGNAARAKKIRERDIRASAAWYLERMGEGKAASAD